MQQATIKSEFSVSGVGVHSNAECRLTVRPAEINTGIVYVINGVRISARYDCVLETAMSTKISGNNEFVMTVEHLSAALYALGVTNAIAEASNNEMPILDGSAKIFAENILRAGIVFQDQKVNVIKVLKSVTVSEENRRAALSPAENFSLDVICDFSEKGLKTGREQFEFGKDDFTAKIAPARTFGFMSEAEHIRAHGLAKGASLENTLIFDDRGNPINGGGMRIPNEPVRHKLLDAIGDLSLCGGIIAGKYEAYCPGHRLNNLLLRKLFSDKSNYEIC